MCKNIEVLKMLELENILFKSDLAIVGEHTKIEAALVNTHLYLFKHTITKKN